MKAVLDKELQVRVSREILGDVYSCLKVVYNMNIDSLDGDVMMKILENHFDLHQFEDKNANAMYLVSCICENIHRSPLKYFNFSYKKPKY